MTSLPTQLPHWYTVDPNNDNKGWTPQTCDIVRTKKNHPIINAWNEREGKLEIKPANLYTVRLNRLKSLSPIQVGGGNLPEGMILPATISGVPYIPGSSLKGAFLSYLRQQWTNMLPEEQGFWSMLTANNCQQWQPRTIRFENILLKSVEPFPLNPQQKWQVFNDRENKLGIQWQVSQKYPPGPGAAPFSLQVYVKTALNPAQKECLETRLTELLGVQGIGRGTASGFGRLAVSIPNGQWEIRLTGMKPCYQPHKPNQDRNQHQQGLYRWSPQVLRASLRGYFTRFALAMLPQAQAIKLSDRIFGGLGQPSQLTLTSFLKTVERSRNTSQDYANIPASETHSTWLINVDCSPRFRDLIGDLLAVSSRLGGLGPGWRRPPHPLSRFNGYRGSEFTVTPCAPNEPIGDLIQRVLDSVKNLAQLNNFSCLPNYQKVPGTIISIWQGSQEQWKELVHGVCSTQSQNRPSWCGDSQTRPSGYAVRQYDTHCWITVFDPAVENTLRQQGYVNLTGFSAQVGHKD